MVFEYYVSPNLHTNAQNKLSSFDKNGHYKIIPFGKKLVHEHPKDIPSKGTCLLLTLKF
jgi:hypothetical protein